MSTTANPNNTKPTNISSKISELDTKVQWFYSDDFNLDEATQKYQEAVDLAKVIESDLDKLKNHIELIDQNFSK